MRGILNAMLFDVETWELATIRQGVPTLAEGNGVPRYRGCNHEKYEKSTDFTANSRNMEPKVRFSMFHVLKM